MNNSELEEALKELAGLLFHQTATVHNLPIIDLERSEYKVIEEPNSDQKSLPSRTENNEPL